MPACLPTGALLEVRELSVSYVVEKSTRVAAEALSFEVKTGEVFGMQGRSGCGKTSAGLALLKLLPANARVSAVACRSDKDVDLVIDGHRRLARG